MPELEVTIESETDSSDNSSAVETAIVVNHAERIATLEAENASLLARLSDVEFQASSAQSTASAALDVAVEATETAETALVEAVSAELAVEETLEAVEAVAEETESPVDDIIVEAVQEDVSVRKPNLWFDPHPLQRIGGKA